MIILGAPTDRRSRPVVRATLDTVTIYGYAMREEGRSVVAVMTCKKIQRARNE